MASTDLTVRDDAALVADEGVDVPGIQRSDVVEAFRQARARAAAAVSVESDQASASRRSRRHIGAPSQAKVARGRPAERAAQAMLRDLGDEFEGRRALLRAYVGLSGEDLSGYLDAQERSLAINEAAQRGQVLRWCMRADKRSYPHFARLESRIDNLLMLGRASDFEAAYRIAVDRYIPAPSAADKHKAVFRALRAAKSVGGGPPPGFSVEAVGLPPNSDTEATVRWAINQQGS